MADEAVAPTEAKVRLAVQTEGVSAKSRAASSVHRATF
jgi:hypothetical protein